MWFSLMLCLILPLTLARPKAALFVLVFLLAFMPRYLGIGLGDEGFALSPRRIALIAFSVGLLLQMMFRVDSLNRFGAVVSRNKFIFALLLSGMLVRFVSTSINAGVGLQLLYVLDDLLITLVPGIGVLLLVHSEDDERHVIVALLVALFATSLVASIETIKGSMLLQGLVSVTVEEAGRSGLTDIYRSGAYRAKAFFDNPLLLAEFACIVWPWAVYLYYAGVSQAQRLFALAVGVAAPVVIFATHARSGWLVFGLGLVCFVVLRGWDRSTRVARLPLVALAAVAFSGIGLIVFQIISDAIGNLGGEVEGARSIVERLNQYAVVAQAWLEAPVFGYGMTRNILTDLEGLDHIDNFWLRLLLEGGVALLVVFLVMAAKVVLLIADGRSNASSRNYRLFMSAALVSALSFLMYKNFVSMPTNNAVFFIVVAMVMRREYWRQIGAEYARTPVPQ
jgi:O-antigen ligase